MSRTILLQSFGECASVEGYRTTQGTVALALRTFDGKQSLIAEVSNCIGVKRAFMQVKDDRDLTAQVAKLVARAQERMAWKLKVAQAEVALATNERHDCTDESLEAVAEDLGIDLSL